MIVTAKAWGTAAMYWVEAPEAIKHPAKHGAAPPPPQAKDCLAQDVNAAESEKPRPSPLIPKIDYVQIVGNCLNQVLNYPLGFRSPCARQPQSLLFPPLFTHGWLSAVCQTPGPFLFT